MLKAIFSPEGFTASTATCAGSGRPFEKSIGAIVKVSVPSSPSDSTALTFFELKWEDTHTDQVRAMDTLEALSESRTYALQHRTLRRPIA